MKIEELIDLSYNPAAYISQDFGVRWVRDPTVPHNGIDIAGLAKFTKVFASGKIIKAGYHFEDPIHAFGNRVAIELNDFKGFGMWLAHFDGLPMTARIGNDIENELVGFVGSSGSSTGFHLHIGIRDLITGEWHNPNGFIDFSFLLGGD